MVAEFASKIIRVFCKCVIMSVLHEIIYMYNNIYVKVYKIYFRKKLYTRIYFPYILFIKVRYINQNIFGIYSKALEIYFRAKKLYIPHIYFIFMGVIQ